MVVEYRRSPAAAGFVLAALACACAHSEATSDFRPPSQLAAEAATTDWLRDLLNRRLGQTTLQQLAQRAAPDFQLSTRERSLAYGRVHQISHSTSAWAVVGLTEVGESSSFGSWHDGETHIEAPPYAHSYRALLVLDDKGTPRWSLDDPELRVNIIDADGDGLREEALVRSRDEAPGPRLWALYDLRETPPAPMLALRFDRTDETAYEILPTPPGQHRLDGGGAWRFESCGGTQTLIIEGGTPAKRSELARYHFDAASRRFLLEGASPEVATPKLATSPWTRTGFRGTHFAYRGRRDPARMAVGIGWPFNDQRQNFPQQVR